MLDPLPAAWRLGKGIDSDSAEIPVDAKKVLQVRHFAAKGHTAAQRLDEMLVLMHVGMGAEEGNESVLLHEVVGQEFSDIPGIKGSEAVELEARDRTVTEFHLGHSRAGHPEPLRDSFLDHAAGLA
jgi:hypothetical protein